MPTHLHHEPARIRETSPPARVTESAGQKTIEDHRPASRTAAQLQAVAAAGAARRNGLPEGLRTSMENLSGYDMGDVRVHYNSSAPAQLNAHAYASGTDIHLAAGQEKHLPHEAWHVVQQKQGRVRPTTSVGGQGVNDNPGLEAEADRMGAKAAQRVAIGTAVQLQSVSGGSGIVQRKKNDLTVLPAQAAFTEGLWPKIGEKITAYNSEDVTSKRYAAQRHQLLLIKVEAQQQTQADIPALDLAMTDLGEEIIQANLEVGRATTSVDDKQRQIEQLEEEMAQKLSTAGEVEERYKEFLQNPITKAQGEKITLTGQQASKQRQLDAKEEELVRVAAKKIAVEEFSTNRLDGEIVPELHAVNQQMTGAGTAKNAEFSELKTTARIKRFDKPSQINAVAKRVSTETEDRIKLILLDKLEKLIAEWKGKHTNPDGKTLKAGYAGEELKKMEAALIGIQQIEQQMLYTRTAVFKAIFSSPVPGQESGEAGSNGEIGFEITEGLLSGVSSEAESVKTGMETEGTPKVFGVERDKGSILGSDLLPKSEGAISGLAIGGDGAEFLGQMVKLVSIGGQWKEASKQEKAKLVAQGLETGLTALDKATSITDSSLGIADSDRGEISEFSKKDAFGKISEMTGDITAGIMALKNAFLTVKYFHEAYKRKGTDDQQAVVSGAKGAIAFIQAAEGGMKLAAGVLKSFYSIAPEPLLRAIPIIGIALDVATGMLSLYNTVKAGQAKKEVVNHLAPYINGATGVVDATGLAAQLSVSAGDVTEITTEEQRGVVGGKEKYLRFNAYTMAVIDEYVKSGSTDKLEIKVDGGKTVELDKEDVKTIREYEYLSKMTEINQKRKTSGIQSIVKTIVSLAGKITTAAGVTAMIGTAIGAASTATSLTYSVAKGGQKIKRNRRRAELNTKVPNSAVGIASFTSQKDYLDARGPKSDRSAQQKDTEYKRHAFYIMDRISMLPPPPPPDADAGTLEMARRQNAAMTGMIKSTGVDMFLFLNASSSADRIKLLVSAQKSGR